MMVNLVLLKYTRGLSNDKVVEWWFDSPKILNFCGETHFQQELRLVSSSLLLNHTHIGESEYELKLKSTQMTELDTGVLSDRDNGRAHAGRRTIGSQLPEWSHARIEHTCYLILEMIN